MDTKLTLSLNKTIIEAAKSYAKSNSISLSKLIEAYLASLTSVEKEEEEISPLVASLIGIAKSDKPLPIKEDYINYLEEKYK